MHLRGLASKQKFCSQTRLAWPHIAISGATKKQSGRNSGAIAKLTGKR